MAESVLLAREGDVGETGGEASSSSLSVELGDCCCCCCCLSVALDAGTLALDRRLFTSANGGGADIARSSLQTTMSG